MLIYELILTSSQNLFTLSARGPRDGKETFRGTERQGGGLPQHGLRRWEKHQVALLLQQKKQQLCRDDRNIYEYYVHSH